MKERFRPRKVYIAASYSAPVGRYNGKELEALTFLGLAEKAGAVFDRSCVSRRDIESVVVGCQNPGAFSAVDNTASKIAGVLGVSGSKSVLIDTASSSGASALEYAYMMVASGSCDHVLALGIQKMSDVSTLDATRIVAGVIDRDEAEFGLTMPACGALVARSLIERLGLSYEEWSAFSAMLTERAHHYASRNPDAHLNFPLSVSDYFEQIKSGKNYRYWSPLRYHDFCPMSDGVAAVILTSNPHPVLVSGVGSATDIPTIADRNYFHSFPATVRAAAEAYGMAGIRDITSFAGKLHVNMHDPFNGFGPVNMVDLGIVPRKMLLNALLDDSLTGDRGAFPTNLTGGLKGRGHPLGATGMIQVAENHRLMLEQGFKAALSHSIGGPINNNVVIILERGDHYRQRSPQPYRPWGLPSLGRLKPKDVSIESLIRSDCSIEGRFVTSTTRHDYRSGKPELIIMLVSCNHKDGRFNFLFGIGGEHEHVVRSLNRGDRVKLEMSEEGILVNRMHVQKFYEKTIDGLVELAGNGWKKITGKS